MRGIPAGVLGAELQDGARWGLCGAVGKKDDEPELAWLVGDSVLRAVVSSILTSSGGGIEGGLEVVDVMVLSIIYLSVDVGSSLISSDC